MSLQVVESVNAFNVHDLQVADTEKDIRQMNRISRKKCQTVTV